jgi:multicomponent Na+:H+ antiporter subunit D
VEAGAWIFVIIVILGSLLTAVFYLRVINLMYFGGPKHEEKVRREEVPLTMLIPIIILAGGSALFGVFAAVPLSMVEPAVSLLLGI